MPTNTIYLMVDGEYVLADGHRIILGYDYGGDDGDGQADVPAGFLNYSMEGPWRRLGGTVRRDIKYVRSFHVQKRQDGASWLLIVNQKQLVGVYPSQTAALQVLIGLFTRLGASKSGVLDVVIGNMVTDGTGKIDPAYNGMSYTISGDDLIATLSSYDSTGITTPRIGYRTSDDGNTWNLPVSLVPVTALDGEQQVETLTNAYLNTSENDYFQVVLTDGITVIAESSTGLKDDVDPSGTLSVKIGTISDKNATPTAVYNGVSYTGSARAWPEWTVEDWPQGITPSYAYTWSYTLAGGQPVSLPGSGQTLDLALVPYGASLTVGAVATAFVNGKTATSADPAPQVAVTVTEEVPVSFVTDPGASDNSPTVGASIQPTSFTYGGTEPVTTTYVWRRNGSAISGATSQTYTTVGLDVGKTLSCVVTINNAFGPSDNRLVDFGIVQAGGVDLYVADIKLHAGFTGSGNNTTPVGPEITDPQPNTTYYAFAYDQFGSVITGEVTWLEDGAAGVAPSFTGTPTGSHFDPTERTVLSISGTAVAGNPDPTVSYLWSDGSTQATLDTDGMLGDAITCTVTASSVWAPSAEVNIDFGTVQEAAGPVMTQHWTIIDTPPNPTTATVVQTGLDIANAAQGWSVANAQGWPIIWVGAESDNYGAVNNNFANANEVAPYLNNWEARFRQDGGQWIDFRGSYDAQPAYGTATWYGGDDPGILAPVTGMVYEIEWYNIGDRPV